MQCPNIYLVLYDKRGYFNVRDTIRMWCVSGFGYNVHIYDTKTPMAASSTVDSD